MPDVYYKNRAKKLFRSARETDRLDEWSLNLEMLSGLAEDIARTGTMTDLEIKLEEKALQLAEGMGDTEPELLKLFSELIERNKFLNVSEIAVEYKRLLDEYRILTSTETVLITTAVPLDEDYKRKMKEKISDIRGKPVVLQTEVDRSLIGGMSIKIGEQVIDGSIHNKLQALKSKINKIHR